MPTNSLENSRRHKIKVANNNKKLYKYKCLYCEHRFKTLGGASFHCSQIHPRKNKEDFMWFTTNGSTEPKYCKCGCGKIMDYEKYRRGDRYFSIKCSCEKRLNNTVEKKQAAKKKYMKNSNNWRRNNKIKKTNSNPENIHNCLFCKYKFKDLMHGMLHVKSAHKDIFTEENKCKQGWYIVLNGKSKKPPYCKCGCKERLNNNTYERYKNENVRYLPSHYVYTTDLHTSQIELDFGDSLSNYFIITPQFYIKDIGRCDFKIDDQNIIIEVNGSFWHCEADTEYSVPKYNFQHKKIASDIKKREWCKANDYHLIEVWESKLSNKLYNSTLYTVIHKIKKLSHSRFDLINKLINPFGLLEYMKPNF